MLLQTFDTEEFFADGVFSIPRRSGWMSSEGAKDRWYQVGLSTAAARNFSRQARLVRARCRNCGAAARLDCRSRNRLPAKRPRTVQGHRNGQSNHHTTSKPKPSYRTTNAIGWTERLRQGWGSRCVAVEGVSSCRLRIDRPDRCSNEGDPDDAVAPAQVRRRDRMPMQLDGSATLSPPAGQRLRRL